MTVKKLRNAAIVNSLFSPVSLKDAIARLGFVQADPIRAPARAQDLILRHRVRGYRADDLEKQYPTLDIEEDFLYAYGFLPRSNWRLLHPRDTRRLTVLQKQVFKLVQQHGEMHPNDVRQYLETKRSMNDWGGYSRSTTKALHSLHAHGLLRIVRRDAGIRVYAEALALDAAVFSQQERVRRLIRLLVNIFAPIPEASLRKRLREATRSTVSLGFHTKELQMALAEDGYESAVIDRVKYIWAAGQVSNETPPSIVRILAPFDPVVWERARFEHFWDWRYRFEAYTPVAKRKFGYYTMPLLWCDRIVGGVNASVKDAAMQVIIHFREKPKAPRLFKASLEMEIDNMRTFLRADRVLSIRKIEL